MKKIQIDRPVVEWKYRSLFGMTKVTWALAPWDIAVDIAVADEEAQRAECPHCGMTVHEVKDGFIWHADPAAAPCEE